MSDLLELAERCERATGPDRGLDALIDSTLRIGKSNHPEWIRKNFPVWRARPDGRVEVVGADGAGGVHWESARFTASIDAAMTLVPEKGWWAVAQRCSPTSVLRNFGSHNGIFRAEVGDWSDEWTTESDFPALALCAAALSARAARDATALSPDLKASQQPTASE